MHETEWELGKKIWLQFWVLQPRTYQNWEQEEGNREHQKILSDIAERVRILAELKDGQGGSGYPEDLIVLQLLRINA